MDYSLLDRAINLINLALYSLEFIDGTLYLPAGSIMGQTSSNAVSYTQTQSPRLLLSNVTIIRTYSSTDSSMFIYYAKGSSSAIVSLANVTIVNGQSNTGANKGKYQIDTVANEYNAIHNVVNISDNGVTSSIVGGGSSSGGSTGGGDSSGGNAGGGGSNSGGESGGGSTSTDYVPVPVNSAYANVASYVNNNRASYTNWTVGFAGAYPNTQANLGITIDTSGDTIGNFTLYGNNTDGITVTSANVLSANQSGEQELVAVQGTNEGSFYLAFRLSHTRLGVSDSESDQNVMLEAFKTYLRSANWELRFNK